MGTGLIVEHAAVTACIHLIERLRKVRFLKCYFLAPNAEIRVSFSALMRISVNGHYLLVRNLHRPECFGPFGGVVKYHDESRSFLDDLPFRPDDAGPGDDMKSDLRGFLPRRKLSKVVAWYGRHSGRESLNECLNRELQEELLEIGLAAGLAPSGIEFKKVRRIEEGPECVPGQRYTQFRIFDICEPVPTSTKTLNFLEELQNIANLHPHLLIAKSNELITGRSTDGRTIGHHAAYLIGHKRVRPDSPAFLASYVRAFEAFQTQLSDSVHTSR